MTALKCFWFLCCFVTCLYAVTDEEVEKLAKEIYENEQAAYNWTAPTDASEYTAGMDLNPDGECEDGGLYDFIIAGGGAAGTVLANRLTERENWNVLVIEAGTIENNYTRIPGETAFIAASDYNWGYISEPLRYFKGFIDQRVPWTSGRALGGTSVVNYMLYARGNKQNYNNWGKNCSGWSYDDVLPYFKKSETESFPGADPGYHGHDGPLHIVNPPYKTPVADAFLQAQEELGNTITDYNGDNQLGFSIAQVSEIKGERNSNSRAFWQPIQYRKNLKVHLRAFVLKILIDHEAKVANGVKYVKDKKCYIAKVSKEVILSAGAISSPKILMLSGVGPRDHLEERNISVVKDLDVGKNLWSHYAYDKQLFSVNYNYPEANLKTNIRMYLNGQGPLTAPAGVQVIGFTRSEDNNSSVPDLEFVFNSAPPGPQPYEFYKNIFGLTRESYEHVMKPQENVSRFGAFCLCLYSKLRGTIKLKSNIPTDYPFINLPVFENGDEDVDTLMRGLYQLIKMANTSAMQKYDAKLIKVVHPLCKNYTWNTDGFWRCMIRNLAYVINHYGGTCKMGPKSDSTAVVDPKCKVHGVKHLRVVDASVIPTNIGGHPWTITTMIAEKASDMIKYKFMVKNKTNTAA